MKNPFLSVSDVDKTEYLTSRCSLNRAVLAKLPLYGIEDGIEGLTFQQIFSTPLIVAEIRRLSRHYGCDFSDMPDAELPKILSQGMVSDDARLRQLTNRVSRRFGNRLGLILLTLRTGLAENRAARDDWDDNCWQYWHDLDTVILTGGLSSSMLGRRLKECILNVFDVARIKPYHIRLFDNGTYVGIMGIAQKLMADDTAALVLDMGQTGFKRAFIRRSGGEISEFRPMESVPSAYMRNSFDSEAERLSAAIDLHKRIVQLTAASFRDVQREEGLCDTILISIANYTHNGLLNTERGGYAKLSLIGRDYARVLEDDLSGELHRDIKVKLVHDSTASALYFSGEKNAACITLGTGFGVGFTDIRV